MGSPTFYTTGKTAGRVDWVNDTLKLAVVADTYVPDVLHDGYDHIAAHVLGTPQTLQNKTYLTNTLDANDITFANITGSTRYRVLYKDGGTLICYWDMGLNELAGQSVKEHFGSAGILIQGQAGDYWFVDYDSASYNKSEQVSIEFTIRRTFLGVQTIRLYVTGGKEAGEDYGIGKNYTGSGIWHRTLDVLGREVFQSSYTDLSFEAGEQNKIVTLDLFNNPALELTRVMTVALDLTSNSTSGVIIAGNKTITIVDDNVDHLINVTAELTSYGAAANVDDGIADSGLNNVIYMQAALDHLRTNHSGETALFYFPAGTYLFKSASADFYLKLPMNTNKTAFWGPTSAYGGVVGGAVLKMGIPYHSEFATLIGGTTYPWNNTQESEVNRFVLANITMDGSTDLFSEWDCSYPLMNSYPYEGSKLINVNAPDGKVNYAIEGCHFKRSAGAAVAIDGNAKPNLYHITYKDNVKPLSTMVGNNDIVQARDIVGLPRTNSGNFVKCVGGLWCEPNAVWEEELHLQDYEAQDGGLLCLGQAHGAIDRFHYEEGDNNYIDLSANVDAGNVGKKMIIRDSKFYVSPYGASKPSTANIMGVLDVYRTQFIGTNNSVHTTTDASISLPRPISGGLAGGKKWLWNFYGCTFSAHLKATDRPGIGYTNAGTMSWRTYPNALVKFQKDGDTPCVFDETLNYAIRLPIPFQSPAESIPKSCKIVFQDCQFNCTTGQTIAGEVTHVCHILNPSGGYDQWIEFDNPDFNGVTGGKLFFLYGDPVSGRLDSSWLLINGDIPKDLNADCISRNTTRTIKKYCYGPPGDKLWHISAITKSPENIVGSPTTITLAAPHGQVGTFSVMFEGFSYDNNRNWFDGLSPDASVPKFTATVTGPNTFTIPFNTFAYTDYSAAGDIYAACYKYPTMRTIVDRDAPGSNPISTKPPGFTGDRYDSNGTYYRCITAGVSGASAWELE